MHSFTLTTSLLALAGHAASFQLPHYEAHYEVVPAPAPTPGPKLGRRQDMDCFASITNEVIVDAFPTASELEDWFSSQTYDIDECTVTAPASLSSDLVEYASSLSDFWEGVESNFDAINTMCDADELRIDLTFVGCSETQTAVFTSGSETETVALPSGSMPPSRLTKTSAAAGKSGMMSLAGVVGIAVVAIAFL